MPLRTRMVGSLLVCLLGGGSSALLAADCGAVKDLPAGETSIRLAEPVKSGSLDIPGEAPMRELPPFCRVTGVLRPSGDSEIQFEVWLPEQGWNGRFVGVGNGGFAGSIWYWEMANYVKRGFAVAGSDAGHRGESADASWAYGHPEKVKDFGWRAVHLTTERAKHIVKVYYGKDEEKAFFDACSDGGREALMEAQRFPEDYDGILAGAPANAWSTMLAAGVGAMQSLLADPRAYISDMKLPAIQKAALDACDAQDGVKDGVIGDPEKCNFDPAVLLCKNRDALDCLTQPQVDALKSLYVGARSRQGEMIFPGFAKGGEAGWKQWIVGEAPGGSLFTQFVQNDFRYIVTGDPKWNALSADLDASLAQSKAKTAEDLDSTNPDLSKFAAHGGKLILYHGWIDAAISPWNTIAYYKSVRQTMGGPKADSFVRLYMLPGMEHCTGGPGPSAAGQFGLATATGPKYGLFDSLENWVTKGSPDEDVAATRYDHGEGSAMKVGMTRPLCAYPKVAKYKGSGDTNDAASFTCGEP